MRGINFSSFESWEQNCLMFWLRFYKITLKSLFQQVYENISKHYEVLACEQLIFLFYVVFTATESFWIFRCKQT